MMGELRFQTTDSGCLRLTGTLNYAAVTPVFWRQSKNLLSNAPSPLHIDLQGITHSDSTGVALLLAWLRLAYKQNKKISFVNLPDQMRAIIHVSELEKLFYES